MSDKSEGPGWWVASDGEWYPPELHPSVRGDSPTQARPNGAGVAEPHRWQGQADQGSHIGPQFPDLFEKALQGSHLADNISVKYDGDDERNTAAQAQSTRTAPSGMKSGGTASSGSSAVGSFSGAAATRRRWRKGH